MSFVRPAMTATTIAALSILLTACGSSSSTTPSHTSSTGAAGVDVTLASGANGDECTASTDSVAAGPITFTVTNTSATGITEFELLQDQKIVGEKENLAPGLPAVSFTVTLDGGAYQIYCPGAATEFTDFTVTGQAAAPATGSTAQILADGAAQYATYVTAQVDQMVTSTQALQDAVDSGDVAAAQKAYGVARPYYERVESDVEGFIKPGGDPTNNADNLDYLIDMRASNLDPAVGWTGFHAVERDLFKSQKITDTTKKYASDLTANVTQLAQLSTTLTYKPEDLANGAAGLLEEVQTNKISGEEEKYSHIDLVDFAANVEGAQQAYAYLKPGLDKIDSTLSSTISTRFEAVLTMLDGYRDAEAIGGYKPYTAALKASDANKLSQTVQALQDSLATIAAKVATA